MPKTQMLINYVPGEECRVAVTTDGKLEELHAERLNAVSHVNNIYVGKVMNVEPSIQAAFIDFGLDHNGFLHISDLHPNYFPGGENGKMEQVGRKTPRRSRPPIQNALKRGQEVIVQVTKEGIGTKGPTLTSYLSIPGRYLVMMPQMDAVGMSRKVEDEELRRKMRDTLGQLDLPEGFGFILRTAGMERNKTELKRDLAYLQRLWKDMERRRKAGTKPRLLYAESDLLVRALRDVLTNDFDSVVIDDPAALSRAAKFIKIVSPRGSTKLQHYEGGAPIFHTFGVEEQIQRIHSREVPLPSGGSLVFDEAEALVAIDVNSGKMRHHGDAETTAYKTNLEAVDEICRQLRLRDLGGLVICDLIDMRMRSHRREIENLFKTNLKKDRARAKTLAISQFGIVEMTRQRMRGSHQSVHFMSCRACEGRGLVQKPDSLANDVMRELSYVLAHERVARVQLVVSPRLAGELLSVKRQGISRLERTTRKGIDVRVSEDIRVGRIDLYAYDERGADIDVDRLPQLKAPADLREWSAGKNDNGDWAVDPLIEEPADIAEEEERVEAEFLDEFDDELAELDREEKDESGERAGKKRRRRGRRGGRGRRREGSRDEEPSESAESVDSVTEAPAGRDDGDDREEAPRSKKRRGRRGGRGRNSSKRRAAGEEAGDDRAESSARDERARPESREEEAPEKRAPRKKVERSAGEEDRLAPRGDSWDLDPADLPAPRANSQPKKVVRSGSAGKAASSSSPKPAPTSEESVSREDSWDAAPEELNASRARAGKKENSPAGESGDRGDSWDIDPVAESTEEPAKRKTRRRGGKKRSKKAQNSANTVEVKTESKAEPAVTSESKKKAKKKAKRKTNKKSAKKSATSKDKKS